MDSAAKQNKFKDLLDNQHEWPCEYMFKFIVPSDQKVEICALFPHHSLKIRESSGGKYLSITALVEVDSADLVIAIYEKASTIEGLIAL